VALTGVILMLGFAGVGSGGLLLDGGIRANGHVTGDATIRLTQCVELMALAWIVVAIRYTGRERFLTRRRLFAVVGFYVLCWAVLAGGGFGGLIGPNLENVLSVVTSLYGVGLTLAGATLVVQTVARHGFVSDWVGVCFGTVGILPWFLSTAGLFGTLQSPVWLLPGMDARLARLPLVSGGGGPLVWRTKPIGRHTDARSAGRTVETRRTRRRSRRADRGPERAGRQPPHRR